LTALLPPFDSSDCTSPTFDDSLVVSISIGSSVWLLLSTDSCLV